ncbi:MAG TPA: SoxR reducing system RseC family protein [Gammaproteobacteria bacterium]
MNSPEPRDDLIQERARVLRVVGATAWVQCESQAGCARCAAGEGCGAGLFAKLLRGRLQELPVSLPASMAGLAAGDQLLLGLSVTAVQSASFLLYGLPLAGLLIGAIGGGMMFGGDAGALAGAITGLASGLWIARWRGARLAGSGELQAVVLRQLAAHEPCPTRLEP